MSDRYVVISTDPEDLTIYNTVLWDGVTPYNPGEGLALMLEEDALLLGYVYPVIPPSPADDMVAKLNVALYGPNATFLALDPPTSAEAHAQVIELTKQVDALIRLTQGWVDVEDGT